MKKGNRTKKELRKIVRKKGDFYYSKSGQAYVDGLSNIFSLENKNDKPFLEEDILAQPKKEDFLFEGMKEFEKVCSLEIEPMKLGKDWLRKNNERILAKNFSSKDWENKYKTARGLTYLIVAVVKDDRYIIKFGQTRKTLKDRIASYNCGNVNNWRTASTTNIKILQSFVTTRLIYELYAIDCSQDCQQIEWHGVFSSSYASPKSLAYEEICNRKFIEQFGKPTLANVQVTVDENPQFNEEEF